MNFVSIKFCSACLEIGMAKVIQGTDHQDSRYHSDCNYLFSWLSKTKQFFLNYKILNCEMNRYHLCLSFSMTEIICTEKLCATDPHPKPADDSAHQF